MTPISHRVFLRFASGNPKQAGLFGVPPRMFAPIFDWVTRTLAAHYLVGVENVLTSFNPEGADQWVKQIEGYEVNIDRLMAEAQRKKAVLRLPTGPAKDHVVYALKYDDGWVYGTIVGARQKKIDWLKGMLPDAARALILQRLAERKKLLGQLGKSSLQPRDISQGNGRKDYVDLLRVRQVLREYASTPKQYKTMTAKDFPVDVRDWKYLTSEEVEGAPAKLADENFESITVELFFDNHVKREGQWNRGSRTMQVDASRGTPMSIESWESSLRSVRETTVHELRHVSQDIIKAVKGLDEIGGLPPRKIRTPGYMPGGQAHFTDRPRPRSRLEHALRDIEFQTNMEDIQGALRHWLKRVPPRLRPEFFRYFTADPTAPNFGDTHPEVPAHPKPDYRMVTLQKEAPAKWAGAVKILFKQVADLL